MDQGNANAPSHATNSIPLSVSGWILLQAMPDNKALRLSHRSRYNRPFEREAQGSDRLSAAEAPSNGLSAVATFPIACQTFFRRNLFIRYFPVQPVSANAKLQNQDNESSSKVQALSIPEQVEQQLDQKLAAANLATTSHPR